MHRIVHHLAKREGQGGATHIHILFPHHVQAPPTKPKTAYQYFCKEALPIIKEAGTADRDVSTVLQEYWEAAEAEETAKYEEMAVAHKARYEKDCASSGFKPETGDAPGGDSKRKASVIVLLGEEILPLPTFGAEPPKPRAEKKNESDLDEFGLLPLGGTAQRRRLWAEEDRQWHLENGTLAALLSAPQENLMPVAPDNSFAWSACTYSLTTPEGAWPTSSSTESPPSVGMERLPLATASGWSWHKNHRLPRLSVSCGAGAALEP